MTNIQLFSGQIKKKQSLRDFKDTKKVERKFKQKIMNVLSTEDHFHKINYAKLSILDNKPALYCIIVW